MKNSIKYIGAIVLLLSCTFVTSSLIAQKDVMRPASKEFNKLSVPRDNSPSENLQELERRVMQLKSKVLKTLAEYNSVKEGSDDRAISYAKNAIFDAEQKLNLAESKLAQFQAKNTLNVVESKLSQFQVKNTLIANAGEAPGLNRVDDPTKVLTIHEALTKSNAQHNKLKPMDGLTIAEEHLEMSAEKIIAKYPKEFIALERERNALIDSRLKTDQSSYFTINSSAIPDHSTSINDKINEFAFSKGCNGLILNTNAYNKFQSTIRFLSLSKDDNLSTFFQSEAISE
jgi:hypothetical protein